MPTVFKEDGFVIRIWLNDHLPRHVHVFKGDGECLINLEGEDGLLSLKRLNGAAGQDLLALAQFW